MLACIVWKAKLWWCVLIIGKVVYYKLEQSIRAWKFSVCQSMVIQKLSFEYILNIGLLLFFSEISFPNLTHSLLNWGTRYVVG